ncbi:sugar transferase [Micromonospora sp. NPDC047074]|uniref:sugar transferase n=1 Tax=Micromonospora sp. NPDC047074 TaxID=3154339 RepID=UPI0033F4D141
MVVEGAENPTPTDRLDDEFDVVLRVSAPAHPDAVTVALDRLRPRVLLLKHSLESIDTRTVAVCRQLGVEILVLARPVYGLLHPPRLRRFGGLPWIRLRSGPQHATGEGLKRCFDLLLVAAGSVLVLPLILAITLVLSCTGAPFYRQRRIGAAGRVFHVVKFRTMRFGAERDTGPVLARPDDERITRIGGLLRRSRLDELPQLWNVLRGDMSLVGPRPERPEFIAEFSRMPHYDMRHLIRPGLTGIAQLTGGYAATVEDKLRCDLLYLNCRSLRVDLTLLALTVLELLRGFPRG